MLFIFIGSSLIFIDAKPSMAIAVCCTPIVVHWALGTGHWAPAVSDLVWAYPIAHLMAHQRILLILRMCYLLARTPRCLFFGSFWKFFLEVMGRAACKY